MQLIIHGGVHATDNDRILKGLLRNRGTLAGEGIAVPPPGRYRVFLRDTLNALSQGNPVDDADMMFWDEVLDQDVESLDRVVLSNSQFFGPPQLILANNILYPTAERRLAALLTLFPDYEIEFCLGLRNPATWLSDIYMSAQSGDFEKFLQGSDPMHIRWSSLLKRIRSHFPQIRLTVWCDEDTPVIWGGLLRYLSGVSEEVKLSGMYDMLASVITEDGYRQFRNYIAKRPSLSPDQLGRVVDAFLKKFARPEVFDYEIGIPGWTDEYVDTLTTLYEDDITDIAGMDGVSLIAA